MLLKTKISRWTIPAAALALLAGLSAASAADPTTAPTGKALITVKVVDDGGKPVSGARVSLFLAPVKKAAPTAAFGTHVQPMAADDTMPPTTPPTTPPSDSGTGGGKGAKKARPKALQSAVTDADGQATFKDVADGTYTIRANLKGGGRGTQTVTIADGQDATVSITLKG
jgi:hypothetical protein